MSPAEPDRPNSSRRDFLTGRAVASEIEWVGDQIAEQLEAVDAAPSAGPTVRLGTRAMATEFAAILNPGPAERLQQVSEALDELHQLESEMTVYRPDGELARLNATAAEAPVAASPRLFEVLQAAAEIARKTQGAYDPTSAPLIELWRRSRQESRIPTPGELADTLRRTGIDQVDFNAAGGTVSYRQPGVELNLGGIGKGFALDRLLDLLVESGLQDVLLHGGKSSILAAGANPPHDGWPVGVRNPLFPNRRMATLLLRNCGMSTSGAGIQFFRHEGKRYGHILDARTGIPAEGVLSVTVLAPTAAEADALSTAFFVMGLEKSREYCDNYADVTVLLTPPPTAGRMLRVHAFNLPPRTLFLSSEHELIEERD